MMRIRKRKILTKKQVVSRMDPTLIPKAIKLFEDRGWPKTEKNWFRFVRAYEDILIAETGLEFKVQTEFSPRAKYGALLVVYE